MKEIGLILNPTDVALDIGKQPTMTPMRLFASRCTYLDMVNVGYITVDLAGSSARLVHLSVSNCVAFVVENVAVAQGSSEISRQPDHIELRLVQWSKPS